METNQELDLDKEYGGNQNKVPGFLLTLLVLTSLNVVYNLYRALKELFVSAESAANIEAEVYQGIEESGVDRSEIPDWVMTGVIDFIDKYAENAVWMRVTDVIYYLLLGVSVVLMFKLRLVGYYLYVAVNVLGVLVVPLLYGFNFIGFSATIMYAIIAVIFIAMYGANRKHLH